MAWLRLDDRFRTHPKIERAQLSGWLALCGICYCAEHLTDGVIPKEAVKHLAPGLRNPYKHAARLVQIGLWHEHPEGYHVHHFLDWNPSKSDVLSWREYERAKKQKQRHHQTHVPIDVPGDNTGTLGCTSPSVSSSDLGVVLDLELDLASTYSDTGPKKSPRQEGVNGTIGPINPHSKPTNLINGAELRRHGSHAWCDTVRDLCVPFSLHQTFQKRIGILNRDGNLEGALCTTEQKLLAWYPTVIAQFSGQQIGDDIFTFWRNQFAAWVGTVSKAPDNGRRRKTAMEVTLETMRRG